MIKFWAGLLLGIFVAGGIAAGGIIYYLNKDKTNLVVEENYWPTFENEDEKPLSKFSFPQLAQTKFVPSKIEVLEELDKGEDWTSNKIMYTWGGRKISGQITIPDKTKFSGKRPVIVMVRGWVDPSEYETGVGTRNVAKVLTSKGFLTISTDFLGYGNSDKPENDVWWERFSKPAQVIQLIKSLETLDDADTERIGFWGHSNGGQITLSVLEIMGVDYPTSLWAPVSVSFPYGILVFTEGTEDDGMALRRSLATLEWNYDVRVFSISSYLDKIKAPIILHQGTADTDVLPIWSDNLANKLRKLKIPVTYHLYQGADHNLRPAWETAVQRDVEFFSEKLKP